MAKKLNKAAEILMWLIGIVAAIGIGGLFINGTMLNVVILKILPLIVHKIVGWVIIGSSVLAVIAKLLKAL